MHLFPCTHCCYIPVEVLTCNFIVKCFQAPAGEVAEDDGEHGKSVVLYILVVKIKTLLGAPIQM